MYSLKLLLYVSYYTVDGWQPLKRSYIPPTKKKKKKIIYQQQGNSQAVTPAWVKKTDLVFNYLYFLPDAGNSNSPTPWCNILRTTLNSERSYKAFAYLLPKFKCWKTLVWARTTPKSISQSTLQVVLKLRTQFKIMNFVTTTITMYFALTLPHADWGFSNKSEVNPSFSTFSSASALPQEQFLQAFLVLPTSQSPTVQQIK